MKTRNVRCWKVERQCESGETVEIYFTVPDFGDNDRLFTCLNCAAIFAVSPDAEYYSGVPFEKLRERTYCAVCGTTLKGLAAYPDTYLYPQSKKVGHFSRDDRTIPPDNEAVVKEFWDPYSG